ncbi:M16 family metallopeptidase [Flavilitoribacter nigricans]|uniref:Peptidase M16 n=1 Tax=Flavilitoribacter nigricans (strain ATCC 23147 / DSM 23189 / NBRC 102662 / NCIMB 1420 / SS-2) TaxID=1122177 RepID=A0A2D0NDI3_FLAN2|nr:pitrilysin family protein [Flavilitoribacter nigricans]PHN06430.1 peptidase M16 [Flavilitoribacter nigricans DSM 23189 = NBRC 102662]
MRQSFTLLLLTLFLMSGTNLDAQKASYFSPDDIEIPYQKFVLNNGLTLIVHEDHKAPIAAVNVWYHVGSKNEKPGKSGFAHLFEHLMFNGSENYDDDYFQALERIGGTDLNGTTNNDRTNYFQNVPLAALDQVLFLESDRMGHLLGAIDQEVLDEQRGVVQNEKRQGENNPYGKQWDLITKAMFPAGHPYSWTVIGEMEDLNAASLEDVHEWFKTYYGPANAVIAIAGDVDAEDIYKRAVKYFGDIPAGPALVRPEVNIPIRTQETRQSYQDRVPEARINFVWNTPEWGSKEAVLLNLASSVLSSGKNSRFYKRLVYDDQIASSANAFTWEKEIASNFIVQANVKPGKTVEEVEAALNEELDKFLKDGPTQQELDRVKSQYFAGFIKGIERIGGFGGKSDILAQHEVYGGSADYYKDILQMVADAKPADVQMAAKKWLSAGRHTLICTPFPEFSTIASDIDRSKGLPEMGAPATVKFPDLERTTLSNGMEVVLAKRPGIPTVVMRMMFDAGYASDQFSKAGTASLAMDMMDEGTKNKSALEINEELQTLGAGLAAYSDLDASYVNLNTLKPTLEPSLDMMADVILRPSFPQEDFDRLKNQTMVQIQREKSQPVQMAIRVMPKFLYGEGHAYSQPLTGSGYESTVQSMTRDDMVKFHDTWIRPNNATLMVVGDLDMAELKPMLEKRFGDWKKGKTPKKNIAEVKESNKGKLYLMDRPESQQSVIIGGYLIDPYGKVDEIARETAVNVLGGEFTARVNMNLREDKHWAYGAYTFVQQAKGQRPMLAYAPVQTDKTKESVQEIIKEFEMFVGDKPVTEEEFTKTTGNAILALPGQWETNNAVMSSLNNQLKYDLNDDYYQTYGDKVRNLELSDVRSLSKKIVRPDDMAYFVVGDKEKILPALKELGLEIVLVDADGNPIPESKAKP